MSQKRTITLLTDFGLSDIYVGVMKGIIARINPDLAVIDLTHEISPQNLAAARFCLMSAYPYFPPETVHVAVVDPGVGSNRRAIALKLSNSFLVGPDNGIFSGVIEILGKKVLFAVELTEPKYWQTQKPSSTFHGRDIFAPTAAYLASGIPIEELGKAIAPQSLQQLSLPEAHRSETAIEGSIQYIDRFGNLITNIPDSDLRGKNWSVTIPLADAAKSIPSGHTYADSSPGELIAIIGSHGWVEIAANGSSAGKLLKLDWGARVRVILDG